MSFGVRLTSEILSADPGAKTPCSVEITNRDAQAARYEISIDGIDPMWVAIPEPVVTIDANESRVELVFLSPRRESESVAGTYPFVVRVRDLESAEARTVQGVLEIRPFHHLSLDINPKKGLLSPFSPTADFRITVMNLGNSEHALQLFATDPEDVCTYEFDGDRITIGPGQTKDIDLTAKSAKRALLAGTKLHGFTVTARSTSVPTVAGSVQAQIEQRALTSPGAFIAFMAFVVLLLAWIYAIPKPPTIEVFSTDRYEVMVGEPVQFEWKSNSSTRFVRVLQDGQPLYDNLEPTGNRTYIANKSGVFKFAVVAMAGEKVGTTEEITITVKDPPILPDPRIAVFEIKPTRQRVGQAFVVRYRVDGATKISLSPPGRDLDPTINEIELTAQRAGKITYRLVATNAAGKTVTKSIDVNVTDESLAEIKTFMASPMEVDPAVGLIKLTWKIENATLAKLTINGVTQDVDPVGGEKEIQLSEAATITLRVFDAQGKATEKTLKLKLKPEAPPDDTTGTTTGGDPAGTGGTTPPPVTTTGGL